MYGGKKVSELKKGIWNISCIKILLAVCCIVTSTFSMCQGIEKLYSYDNDAKYSIENIKCIKHKSLGIQRQCVVEMKANTEMHFFRVHLSNCKRGFRSARMIFSGYQIRTLKRPRKPSEYFEKVVVKQCSLHYDTLCKIKILQMKDGKKYTLLFKNR